MSLPIIGDSPLSLRFKEKSKKSKEFKIVNKFREAMTGIIRRK
jgi:hypothetical protein